MTAATMLFNADVDAWVVHTRRRPGPDVIGSGSVTLVAYVAVGRALPRTGLAYTTVAGTSLLT